MDERRRIDRVAYPTTSVIVLCDTLERIFVETKNVSPLGMAVTLNADAPDIEGKDIIIITDTIIMYATVIRQERNEDGSFAVGIQAKKFTQEVLAFLFDSISGNSREV